MVLNTVLRTCTWLAIIISQNVLDYGPLSSFWCFAFERFNGLLEGFQKSWMGPERQMFWKMLNMQHIYSYKVSEFCKGDEFLSSVLSTEIVGLD